jgi:hypothetical protein
MHDLTAARIWGIVRELAAAGLITLAGTPCIGAGEHVLTPYRGLGKPDSHKAAYRAHAQLRAPSERAHAQSKAGTSCARSAAPLAGRAHCQGHPRPSNPRDRRMKKAQCTQYRRD